MKDLRVYRTARRLPFALLLLVVVATVGASDAWAKAGKGKGNVQIGFTGTPPPGFQGVLLNVQQIRINPKLSAGPGDKKWENIPVPSNGMGAAGRPGDLQIDLNANQNVPVLFNTAEVRVDTYVQAELLLDANNPGNLVPRCPNAGALEGCVNYPFQLANTGQPLIITGLSVAPTKQGLATLVLNVDMTIAQGPTTTNKGFYVVNLAISQNAQPNMATISGTVANSQNNVNKRKVRKLTVTAMNAGTSTVVASAPVDKGAYTLTLPAGPNVATNGLFGVLYDLSVTGGSNTYDALRLPPLIAGSNQTPVLTITQGQTLGTIAGKITDQCTGGGIVGATLSLLVPPDNHSGADCTMGECVVVATANTDNTGNYPLPGTVLAPAPFNQVPIPTNQSPRPNYTMMVSAPGYDTRYVLAVPTGIGKNSTCTPSDGGGNCDLSLSTATINGTIFVVPPLPGQVTMVQVFAEDAGTNMIENALPMPVMVRSNSGNSLSFSLNVPALVPKFDLFATTIDLFQGLSDPYQGHTIAVVSQVANPGACMSSAPVNFPVAQTITCVGHGSISGTLPNANIGASVALSKVDTNNPDPLTNRVQITNTAVQNVAPNDPSTNIYGFCQPADTYEVQRMQLPQAANTAPVSTPTPFAVGTPAAVTIATPVAIPSPSGSPTPGAVTCPTTCSFPDGSCPGTCVNAFQELENQ